MGNILGKVQKSKAYQSGCLTGLILNSSKLGKIDIAMIRTVIRSSMTGVWDDVGSLRSLLARFGLDTLLLKKIVLFVAAKKFAAGALDEILPWFEHRGASRGHRP